MTERVIFLYEQFDLLKNMTQSSCKSAARSRFRSGQFRRLLLAASLLLPGVNTLAHEYWLQAAPYSPAVGASSNLTLQFGELFHGEHTPFVLGRFTRFEQYSSTGMQELGKRVPRGLELPRMPVMINQPGSYLIAFDAAANYVTLPADKFFDYLHDEGLDAVNRQRAASGQAGVPGRERYYRNVKTLLRGGGQSDDTYAVAVGQHLEIMPHADPLALKPGQTLTLSLRFAGQPLAGALLKAWHKKDGQLTIVRSVSDASGQVSVALPWAGEWMLSVVHMTAAVDTRDADWDSYWGSLAFEVLP